MFDQLALPFVQRGVEEVLALAVAGGLLGTWIVLRGLAFYAHAIATATFPGLVVADGIGLAAPLGAGVAAGLFGAGLAGAGGATRLEGDDGGGHGTPTALVLVACLAVGALLASDVFGTGANVETLLFGSLLLIGHGDVALAAATAVLVVTASLVLGPRWLAVGFDGRSARGLGVGVGRTDAALLALVGLTAVAALVAVGALLATAVLVVPAATVRLLCDRLVAWQLASVALGVLEGVGGLWLSVRTDAPPGATIAVLGGVGFVAALGVRRLRAASGSRLVTAAPVGLALAAVALVGWGTGTGSGSSRALAVVATTTQLGDLARAVGGDAVEVHQILRANTDPHDYEPRPSDVEETARATVVLESGRGLDGWMGRVVADAGSRARIVDVGAAVPVARPGDPHWWQDPVDAEAAVREIARALARANPEHAGAVAHRAAVYLRRLRSVSSQIAACFARVAPARRRLVTDHDAFGYFARRFAVQVVGAVLPAQTTEAQASAGALARLAALVRREHVRAIFPETSLNPRLVAALARETGARADLTLYGDTLGPPGSAGDTYLRMLAANADAMVRGFTGGALGCRVRGAA